MLDHCSRKEREGSLSDCASRMPRHKRARVDEGIGDEQKTNTVPQQQGGEYYMPSARGEFVGPDRQILLKNEIGKGTSSVVFQCIDMLLPGSELVAKIIRKSSALRQAAKQEIALLRRFRSDSFASDPEGTERLLGLAGIEAFEHQGHLSLVFERQKFCLKTALMKYGQERGLPLVNLQSIARDIFLGLRVLRRNGIIHCDLKPANLLVSLDGVSVKLADFGSAQDMSQRFITDQLQPTFYRAPEIILGQLYGMEIDVWSAGLSLFELATGSRLMLGNSNNAMLHAMLKTLGAFPMDFSTAGVDTLCQGVVWRLHR
eukprot:TRINITY_DN12525_c0_g1_i3.p1 TRINITY_DN12525_c0_g1~~TRINITY_DN12525_c0_g1_i3.p1  ORF type:complete len:316 (+),score=43.16 TRINITY_DN12525_c0_g1_i3:94-1041(+)